MTSIRSDGRTSPQTRATLINRLKSGDDPGSWEDFYRNYGKLVRDFARQAGLTDAEADDATQETMIGIVRSLPDYEYDPKVCRFKTWLLNQTSWRIKDQLKKRNKQAAWSNPREDQRHGPSRSKDDTTSTAAIQI